MKINYARKIFNFLISPPEAHIILCDPNSELSLMTEKQKMLSSWGAHSFIQLNLYSLQFKVDHIFVKGYVRIAYAIDTDLYDIRFGSFDAVGLWKSRQVEYGVNQAMIHDVIAECMHNLNNINA